MDIIDSQEAISNSSNTQPTASNRKFSQDAPNTHSAPNARRKNDYEKLQIEEGQKKSKGNKSKCTLTSKLAFGAILLIAITTLIAAGVFIQQNSSKASLNRSFSEPKQSELGLTAIFVIVNDQHKALQSINSFVKNNLCNKIIIASHEDLRGSVGQNLKNATWVIQRRPEYDIYFVDELVKKVQTEYFFYSTTEWEYYDNIFVDFSLRILKQFPEISQILPKVDEAKFLSTNTKHEGFSFLPGVHRRKDYLLIKDGYPSVSPGLTRLSDAEQKISDFYLSKGLYILLSPDHFNIFKVGTGSNLLKQKLTEEQKYREQALKNLQDSIYDNKNKKRAAKPETPAARSVKRAAYYKIFSLAHEEEGVKSAKNLFANSYQNGRHFGNFYEYLNHNGARKVLLINCDDSCRSKYTQSLPESSSVRSVAHISEVLNANIQEIYDWISSENLEGFISSIIQKNIQIGLYTNFGVSLRWPLESYDPSALSAIVEYFKLKGFYYDEIKSLNLRKPEGKMIMVFIKGKSPEWKGGDKSTLAIQTVFNMKQDILFLREWLIYHVSLGFYKFYLYDTSAGAGQSLKSSTGFGMSLDCIDLSKQELATVWRSIWTEFYDHIVYVPWYSKDGQLTSVELQTQRDYLYLYKDIAKYTLFISMDQLLFSPENKSIIPYLRHYSQNRISSIKFKQRRFVNRFCAPNKRLTEITEYFPEDQDRMEVVGMIVETNAYLPSEFGEGKPMRGRQIVIPADQFRINRYSFEKNELEQVKAKEDYAGWRFFIDNGTLRNKDAIDKGCMSKCSEIFSISCPPTNSWNSCLELNVVKPDPNDRNFPPITPPPKRESFKQETIVPRPNPVVPVSPAGAGNKESLGQYLGRMQTWLQPPRQYFQFSLLKKIMELPMCLVIVPTQKYSESSLLESIKLQNYSNYRTLSPPAESSGEEKVDYYYYRSQIKQKCVENTLIMFVRAPLKENALKYVNQNLQQYEAWVAYTKDAKSIEVVAFFYRIYDLLDINDFKKTNQFALKENNRQLQTVGLLELCVESNRELQKQKIVDVNDFTYFSALRDSAKMYDRVIYTKLMRLSQDIDVNVGQFERSKGGIASLKPGPIMKLTTSHMFRAANREEEWYLPDNHTIQVRQFEQYSESYKINEYKEVEKQVRFCITILSHNNIQNNRYIKVMKSIVMQKYENYHIVFIDDNSDDRNMNGTIEFMESIKFPKDRIVYVQNKQRNYATYNIMNAAYNFCHEDDVQMLMDGDDEFIGKYAFQVMNSAYQQQPDLFVAYSNYKTNYYGFGRSRGMSSEFDHAAGGRRSYISIFGPIRTWRTQVVYNIPLAHHKMQNGEWLDTVYDDALSHPLFQLAGVSRVRYLPEILYEYNIRYGDNDDSTSAKIKHRGETYRHVLSIPILHKLASLNGTVKDASTDSELRQGNGVRYEIRDP